MITEKFQDWMKNKYNLMERTLLSYRRVIERFFVEYDEPTIENINKFITSSTEKSNSFYIKYAFRYYLEFIGKGDDYKLIKKIKQRPRKRVGVYVDSVKLVNLVNAIENPTHRVVAIIQYLTGARTGDVLRLSIDNVKANDDSSLSLTLDVKGGKKHTVFIPIKYSFRIAQFIKTRGKKYPFLESLSSDITKSIDTNYRYYYNSIKKAAFNVDLPDFQPHDFRRNFLEDVFESTNDIRIAQNLAGHSNITYTMKYIKSKETEEKLRKVAESVRG